MNISSHKNIFSILTAFFLFIIINMPSIKLLYSSILINIIGFAGLWGIGIIRVYKNKLYQRNITRRNFNYIFNFLWMWLIMFWITWLIKPETFDFKSLFQYISVLFITIGISLFVKNVDLIKLFWLQIIWGSFLSILEITIGIPKDISLGQNYLTSGVAISLTLVILTGYYFSRDNNLKTKLFLLPVVFLLLNGLSTLSGRAPILFSLIVPCIIFLISVFLTDNKKKKIILLLLFPIVSLLAILLLIELLPTSTLNRILRMFISIKDEPRYELYEESISIILKNPLGIGLTGQQEFHMMYPHNIFLEVLMAGGISAVIPLIIFLNKNIKEAMMAIKNKKDSIIWLSAFLYLFFTWNISFDLSSSYILFSINAIFNISTAKESIIENGLEKNKYIIETQ